MKSGISPLVASVLCLFVATHTALAVSTFIVSNPNNAGTGSLRQAILDANATPNSGGPDLINFAVPGGGVKTISPTSPFPMITDPVVIDGTTQGVSATPLIELDGTGAGASVDGLIILAGGSTIKGLAINRFGGDGLVLRTGGGNTIQKTFIGTSPDGTIALGNNFTGLFMDGSPNNLIGGTGAGEGNVISASGFSGIAIGGTPAIGNQVKGNLIGTDVTGTVAFGNSSGIYLGPTFVVHDGSPSNTTIGGPEPGAGNVISGNDGRGIIIFDTANTNVVQGNLIGTNAAGTGPLGNSGEGIVVEDSSNNTIGGTAPGARNIISGNGEAGIFIGGVAAQGNQISGNVIFSNGGVGIDLEDDGVTPNDGGDGDTGANNLQNFPILTSANASGGSTTIQGSLNSTANTTFHVEFFSSPSCDSSSNGEGQTFLGTTNVTTVGNDATINAVLPVFVAPGRVVTATATDPANNTSEFSACVTVTGTGPTPTPPPSSSKLLNISTRMRVETGSNVLIGGFIIVGSAPKSVAIRGVGPSLAQFGIPDLLADPTLELHGGKGALLRQNDNWQDDSAQAAELTALGLALQNPNESGMVDSLAPSAYTAILAGKNNGTGVGLVEVYDTGQNVDGSGDSQLANISTRGFVLTDSNVMIGGFILGGGDIANIAVRGIGPSLADFLSPVLPDPTLELHDGNGALLVSNDNWEDDPTSAAQLTALGLAPPNSAESGIYVSLPPGAFTAIVAGKNGGTGIGLVEIYNIPQGGGGGGFDRRD